MSRTSLRFRLAAAVVAVAALALVGLALALDAAVRTAAWRQHDRGLAGRAQALAALVGHDEDGYEFELAGTGFPGFAPPGHPAYFELWLPDGSVLARSPALAGRDLAAAAGRQGAPRLADVTLPDGRPGRQVSLSFRPRDEAADAATRLGDADRVTLVLAEDTEDVRRTLAGVRTWIWTLGLATLLGLALASAWLVARGLAPLARLAAELDAIDHRHLSARLSIDGQPRELATPVRKLNQLLARLDESFARERRFTADASHELRTPLAGLRTLLEVTALKARTGDEYRGALADVRAITIQLATLVDDLLTLARLDHGQVELAREDLALAALVDECWRPHAARAAQRRLVLRNEVDARTIVRTDGAKLRVVLANLLANAAEYTEAGGWIEVRGGTGDGVLVDVTDSGPPIPEAQLERVFDCFWRADAARSAGSDAHSGIGLSLVRALCTCLDLAVSAASLPDGRVRFRIRHRPA